MPATFVTECHGQGGYIKNPVVTRQVFPGVDGAGGAPSAGPTPQVSKALGAVGGGFGQAPGMFGPPAATARPVAAPAANPWAGFNWNAWFGGHGY